MRENILQKLFSDPLMFIGYFSGNIYFVMIIGIFLYYKYFFWTGIYILFYIINYGLILFLQNSIRDPRPTDGREFIKEEFHNSEAYGMPSGHTQTAFFSLVFFYMVTHSISWLIIMLFIAVCTIMQRLIYKKHFARQIILGSIIGSILGYSTYFYANDYKKNGYIIYNVSK
jgi:membrane-associated phospholipid phosphatase